MTVAQAIARTIVARGVERVFGLEGGHIQPVWDELVQLGVPIVDVRDERAAVHMAHAHAELTRSFGLAMVTAGPGVTNAVTGVANASVARAPVVVIGGCAPRPQAGLGALQDVPQVAVMQPIARSATTVRSAEHAIRELDRTIAAALGDGGEPGAAYIEFPTDVLREPLPPGIPIDEFVCARERRVFAPDAASVTTAVDLLWSARRPVVVSGRGARDAAPALLRLLDRLGAVHLDTQESRGVVPEEHPSSIGSMRAVAMRDADVVLTVGRKLDYQLGYGSPAVFPAARFVRIADTVSELRDNRRGDPEVFATPALALDAVLDAAGTRAPAVDRGWAADLRRRHRERSDAYGARLAQAPAGADGRMHPNRIFAAIRAVVPPDAIAIADGGDILSFARLGLTNDVYLDSGVFGCLGVGVPFAVAAALAFPGRAVVSVNGDGAFGFNAMEIDTAVRHGAKAVFIVANNAAWNIERYDQNVNYAGRIAGTELRDSDYAGLARALGAYAERVVDADALPGALERALAAAPSLLDVVVTRDAVSSDAGKGLGYVPTYQPLEAWDAAERELRATATALRV